jgi:hypothetical protein
MTLTVFYKLHLISFCIMAEKDSWNLISVVFLWVFGMAFTTFILYGPSGAAYDDSNMATFFFFGLLGAMPVFVMMTKTFLKSQGFFSKNPDLEGFDRFLTANSPEDTLVGKAFPFLQPAQNLALVSLILSMVVAASISVSGQFVGGSPELVQGSISDSASLALALEPAVSAETLFFQFMALWLTVAFVFTLLRKRGIKGWAAVIISKFVAWLFTTGLAYLYHSFRYGAYESSQGGVLVLFAVLNGVTLLTNSIIPAYLIHGATNVFSKASSEGIWSSEFSIVIAAVLSVTSVVIMFVKILRWSENQN